MPLTVNRKTFEQMIAWDLEWLLAQPRTIERDHVEEILRHAARAYYPEMVCALAGEQPQTALVRLEPLPSGICRHGRMTPADARLGAVELELDADAETEARMNALRGRTWPPLKP